MGDEFKYNSVPWYKHPFRWWVTIDTFPLIKSIWIGPLCFCWSTWEMGNLIDDIREGLRYASISYIPDYETTVWTHTFIDD